MKEKDLKIGKCYRKVYSKYSNIHVGVVFQITGVEADSTPTRVRYGGVRLYTPYPSTFFGKGMVFCTEDFDEYEEVSEEELKKGYEKLVWIAQKAKRGLEISASVASGKGFSADIDAARMADLIGIGLLEEESPDSGEVLIKTNVIENWVNWEQGKPEAWTPQIKDFTEVRRLIKFAFENPDWYEDRVLGLALEKAERVRKTEV